MLRFKRRRHLGRFSLGFTFGGPHISAWSMPFVSIHVVKPEEHRKKEEKEKAAKHTPVIVSSASEGEIRAREGVAWGGGPHSHTAVKPAIPPPKTAEKVGSAKGFLSGATRGSSHGPSHVTTGVESGSKTSVEHAEKPGGRNAVLHPPSHARVVVHASVARPRLSLWDIKNIRDERRKYQDLAYYVSNFSRRVCDWTGCYLEIPPWLAGRLQSMGFDLGKLASYVHILGYNGIKIGYNGSPIKAGAPAWFQEELREEARREAHEGYTSYLREFRSLFKKDNRLYNMFSSFYGAKSPEEIVGVDLTREVSLNIESPNATEEAEQLCRRHAVKGKVTVIGTRGAVVICNKEGRFQAMTWNEGLKP